MSAFLTVTDQVLGPAAVQPAEAAGVRHDAIELAFRAARRGDDRALDELCRLVRPRLYRVAYSVLKDRDEADDLAQEALVRALGKWRLFRGSGTALGWMSRIAFHLALNHRRDRNRRRELASAATEEELDRSRSHGPRAPDASHDAAELERALEAALQGLPKRQREVLTLRLVGELSFKDIGDTLGMTEANARVTAHQALPKLRQALRPHSSDVEASISRRSA